MDVEMIRQAIQAGRVRVSDHADEEATADNLRLLDVYRSVHNGEIIEDYPSDRPFPSCLVLGTTTNGDPIHSVWAYNAENAWAVLITVYRPDPNRWVNWRQRRSS